MPCGLTTFFSSTGSARNRSRKKRHSFNSIIKFVSYVSRFPPLYHFFPVSMAVLKHTFPSRTRLLRGPATMILHIRVWESSSTPDFFCTFSGNTGNTGNTDYLQICVQLKICRTSGRQAGQQIFCSRTLLPCHSKEISSQ